ncbi:cysteine dioxygenase family protein [Roseomonas haemaphysalidis]|nr:cysteine dioxygenase family protein [Roseomonas haemaphysalidis]
MNAFSSCHSLTLSRMLSDIHRAVIGTDGSDRPARIAAAMAPHLRQPDLLSAASCESCPNGYIRHLLHADREQGYAVVALVWRPGQMSPVHAHRTWCALGVHTGSLTEGFYALPDQAAQPVQTAALLRRSGDTSSGPADPDLIHRLSNLSMANAISIHAYGADFDRFGSDVNLLY